MQMKEALMLVLPQFFDVFSERYREDDGEPVRYIADTSELDIDGLAKALEDALGGTTMTEDQVKHMVNRFLMWKLPESFHPDGGITFEPEYNVEYNASRGLPPSRRQPVGTNLLGADQAEAMVRHMIAELPKA